MVLINRSFVVIVSFIFLIGFVSSSLNFQNYSIDKVYSKGSNIKGYVNFSTENEPGDGIFTTSFGSSISLYNFLNRTIGENNFDCVPDNCDKAYSGTLPTMTKSFQLNNANQRKKIMGFVVTGRLDNINSGKLTFSSNAQTSCSNQIEIDILDDGTIDFANNNTVLSGATCPGTKTYGCYDSNRASEQFILNIACQKMNLSVAPGFSVGSQVKREIGERNLKMDLYDKRGVFKGTCNLAALNLGEDKEIFCDINHLVTQRDEYYVCVRVDGVNDPNNRYTIKGYSDNNGCALAGVPSINSDHELAFKIFATAKQFGPVGSIAIKDTLPNGDIFSRMAYNYLLDQYGEGLNCDENQCIIPISIKGNVDQDVTLSGAEIIYTKSGATASTNNFFDVSQSAVKITSKSRKINLDVLNLSVPSVSGNSIFILSYNSNQLLSQEITIADIPNINTLIPTGAPAAIDILFIVNASSPNNLRLTKYIWELGNGDKKETSNNSLTYKYNNTGNYNVKVTVIDESNFNTSKVFQVTIGKPDQVANNTLKTNLENLQELKTQINEYDAFTKEIIEKKINITNIEYELETLKRNYASAYTDEDYIRIVEKLNKLNIPDAVYSSASLKSASFVPNTAHINLDTLNEIGNDLDEDIDESVYVDAINSWIYDNVLMKVTYDKIMVVKDSRETFLTNIVDFEIIINEENEDDVYFIMKDFNDIEYAESYSERKSNGQVYIHLTEKNKHIKFSTSENINFQDIPAFVSTYLGNLEISIPAQPICVENDLCEKDEGETWKNCRDCHPWKEYGYTIIGLIILYLILHILLQEWYKNHYENYLFKNKNFLFNIMNYIHQEKMKGQTDSEIEKNLKKSGWNNEQVRYAMRKFYGKRTGMWEIPMDWLFNNFRKKRMPKYDPRTMPLQIGGRRY